MTLPYLVATLAGTVVYAIFGDAGIIPGFNYAFPRLHAATELAWILFMLGLYELAKMTKDKLVAAFAAIALLDGYRLFFLQMFLGGDAVMFYDIASDVCAIAMFIVCVLMLVRARRARRYAVPAALTAFFVLFSPHWIFLVSEHATPTTDFLKSKFAADVFGVLLGEIVPVALLWIYIHSRHTSPIAEEYPPQTDQIPT